MFPRGYDKGHSNSAASTPKDVYPPLFACKPSRKSFYRFVMRVTLDSRIKRSMDRPN